MKFVLAVEVDGVSRMPTAGEMAKIMGGIHGVFGELPTTYDVAIMDHIETPRAQDPDDDDNGE